MLTRFIQFIESNQLFSKKGKLLVATSGGVDSMVLCDLLSKAKYDIAIAHCNFQLRGDESDKDEAFVKNLGKNFNVSFHSKKFETQKFSTDNKLSTQLAARQLRYEWFQEIITSHGFDHVVTAHHASDQAETLLYNLTKGTGLSGVRGIPVKNKKVVRPLLFANKTEILEYAEENNLDWREDVSNREDKYSRNLIRNQVIPELQKINPAFEKTMLRNIDRFQSIDRFIQAESNRIKAEYLTQNGSDIILNLEWLSSENKILLNHLLTEYDFNYFQVNDIVQGISLSGNTFLSESHQLLIDRNQLLISPIQNEQNIDALVQKGDNSVIITGCRFSFEIKHKKDIKILPKKNMAFVDHDKVNFPIQIRNWHQSDRFIPLGMNSEKKLSDFMIDEKIPVNLKKRLPIFTSGDKIVWIAGHRIDDRFKVTDATEQVLIIDMTS